MGWFFSSPSFKIDPKKVTFKRDGNKTIACQLVIDKVVINLSPSDRDKLIEALRASK